MPIKACEGHDNNNNNQLKYLFCFYIYFKVFLFYQFLCDYEQIHRDGCGHSNMNFAYETYNVQTYKSENAGTKGRVFLINLIYSHGIKSNWIEI